MAHLTPHSAVRYNGVVDNKGRTRAYLCACCGQRGACKDSKAYKQHHCAGESHCDGSAFYGQRGCMARVKAGLETWGSYGAASSPSKRFYVQRMPLPARGLLSQR